MIKKTLTLIAVILLSGCEQKTVYVDKTTGLEVALPKEVVSNITDTHVDLMRVCINGTQYWVGDSLSRGYLAPVIQLTTNDELRGVKC